MKKLASREAVAYILHDDAWYLTASIESFRSAGPAFAFVSRVPWHDAPGDWEAAAEAARAAGAEVVEGEWRSELEHRQAARAHLLERGVTHALIPDGDELIEPGLLKTLVTLAERALADRVYVAWDTYWKTPEYVIRPREAFTPCILVDLRHAEPAGLRNFEGGRPLFLPAEHGIIHHLSYCGPDERIRRKLATWGHRDEVVPGWFENVWLRWDEEKLLRNLHPTHPPAYGFAERVPVPSLLQPAKEGLESQRRGLEPQRRGDAEEGERAESREGAANLPPLAGGSRGVMSHTPVSVIIPVHGGADDLRACLESLARCGDLVREVIVVDNASPDDAAAVAETPLAQTPISRRDTTSHENEIGAPPQSLSAPLRLCGSVSLPPVRVLRNPTNRGFAAACNQGLEASTGDEALFLNSDTVVPRAGLERLVEALAASGSIAAAGPYTNFAGHGQQIAPTYTHLDTLDLFAEEFAARPAPDVETDMLVGFCLAAKRGALVEIGGFDEQFCLGTFEDNDLCYRLRCAGYRLVIAARSYVHHEGSRTLQRTGIDVAALMAENAHKFQEKWRDDLESGYASHLSGLAAGRIVFQPDRHPDLARRRVRELARRADISLAMIVKNEERVLGACLESAAPFFREMIVVDTGSTDRTVEIAEAAGARVFHMPWQDSFSLARNESLRHAQGRWTFWMDADDTLPFRSGEMLLEAALNAPPEAAGFVVPVQFVESGGPASGTRVDHVKLFRNLPGVQFEGRLHEQILPSLRERMPHGQILRCGAIVLHSGYDTSPEGQAKKRERDYKLLKLDLEERPDHPFVLFCYGMTDHYCGEHERAISWLTKSIALSQADESQIRKAYALLAASQTALGRPDEALATLAQGLAAVDGDVELHFQAARLHAEQNRFEEAREHYLQALACDPEGHYSSIDMGIRGFKTWHNLGGVCQALGRYHEARDWWRKAIESVPQFTASAFELFNAALETQDLPTCREMLEHVRAVEGPGESWAAMGVRYAESLSGPAAGEEFLRRAAADFAGSAGPRLLLARRLLQSGREEEAREHLTWLAAHGVAEAAFNLGVMSARHGALKEALEWTERAVVLDPGAPAVRQQAEHLAAALAAQSGPAGGGAALTFEEALAQVAAEINPNGAG